MTASATHRVPHQFFNKQEMNEALDRMYKDGYDPTNIRRIARDEGLEWINPTTGYSQQKENCGQESVPPMDGIILSQVTLEVLTPRACGTLHTSHGAVNSSFSPNQKLGGWLENHSLADTSMTII